MACTKKGGEIILLSTCNEGIGRTHEQGIESLAGFDDDMIKLMLKRNRVKDRFAAASCMYYNHTRKNFRTSLITDLLTCNLLGFFYLNEKNLAGYLERRLKMNQNIKIGIINNSTEVLPVLIS